MSIFEFLKNIRWIADSLTDYFSTHHILITLLVAIGTFITAINGMRNSSHMRLQADIQRQIETNRYNLQLFNSRLQYFDEFKKYRQNIISSDEPTYNRHIMEELISLTEKCISLFEDVNDNNLNHLYNTELSMKKDFFSKDETEAQYKNLLELIREPFIRIPEYSSKSTYDRSIIISNIREQIESLEGKKQQLNTKLKASVNHYPEIYKAACAYMQSRLKVPQNAFQLQPNFIKAQWIRLKKLLRLRFFRR